MTVVYWAIVVHVQYVAHINWWRLTPVSVAFTGVSASYVF